MLSSKINRNTKHHNKIKYKNKNGTTVAWVAILDFDSSSYTSHPDRKIKKLRILLLSCFFIFIFFPFHMYAESCAFNDKENVFLEVLSLVSMGEGPDQHHCSFCFWSEFKTPGLKLYRLDRHPDPLKYTCTLSESAIPPGERFELGMSFPRLLPTETS